MIFYRYLEKKIILKQEVITMKKLISYLVILLLVFSLISCGKVQEQPGDGGGDIDNPIVNPGGSDNPVKPPVEDKVNSIAYI